MNPSQENESEFRSALARFERILETPRVPGELPNWSQNARQACEEVGVLLRHEIQEKHGPLLRDIAQEDIELAARVENLKADDESLLSLWKDVRLELDRLCDKVEQVEPHEAKLDEPIEQLIAKALNFIIAARKQEIALSTWYMEAFNRDRGIAD